MSKEKKLDFKYGYIYLIREREFVNSDEHVYKIGATIQKNPSLSLTRFNSYKRQSQIICICICESPIVYDIESELKKIFKYTFVKHPDGHEYFIGDPNKMIEIIYETMREYKLVNEFNDDMESEEISCCEKIVNDLMGLDTKCQLTKAKLFASKCLFMHIYNITDDMDRDVIETKLTTYLENDIKINRSFSLSQGFEDEIVKTYNKYSGGNESLRKQIIIHMYNILTRKKHKDLLPLSRLNTIKITSRLFKRRVKKIVSESIYFKDQGKYHSLFFPSRKRYRTNSKTNKEKHVTRPHTVIIKKILAYYGIILKIYKYTKVKGKKQCHYKIFVTKEVKDLCNFD